MTFIRFFNRSPNPFDDPDHKDFETLTKSYFEPRAIEDGKPSFFLNEEGYLERIVAGFIAIKKDAPENQRLIIISNEVFVNANITITPQTVDGIFSCIASLHYCADFNPYGSLEKFISELKNSLSKKLNKDYLYQYNKTAYRKVLYDIHKNHPSYEKEYCSRWVVSFIEAKEAEEQPSS
ncbi:hypothetical protein JWG44_19190 [Leptospira sp. 201903071]|uniref:hypothetical protein n=1 Tax=Leptospira ainazelensis TaxID=2810034 RepID=UPI0019635696|nr:hypothetical protein [Leptospira ainazelensis]MBM9502381.1 hypothetical protein [Leptospira ainazelensis]